MSTKLTAGQKALIESALRLRLAEVEKREVARMGGRSRADHAHEVLEQDGDDASQRLADREVDLTLSDAGMVEIGEISSALLRIDDADFGLCRQCGVQIPFDRLKLKPHALHCVTCESAVEQSARGRPS